MKIAVDAMGGDSAPSSIVEGAMLAGRTVDYDIILVGDKSRLTEELSRFPGECGHIQIRHASQVIEMEDLPVEACRKKPDSSIMVATQLAGNREADAFVSAGNSGAVMAASLMNMKRLSGVSRPVIAAYLPTQQDFCILLDVGANVDCKAKHLYQFAVMGDIYVKHIFKKRMPRVALLNIGSENSKGNEAVMEAYRMLNKADLNFIGNIEGRDITLGKADVIVCDGFVGNIVLKFGESVAEFMVELMKREFSRRPLLALSSVFMKGALKKIMKKIDYTEYGGAPLLGIDGVCIITHGAANAKAISNAIKMAGEFVEQNVNQHIKEKL